MSELSDRELDARIASQSIVLPQAMRRASEGFILNPLTVCVECGDNRNSEFRRCWCGSVTVRLYEVTVTPTSEPIVTPWPEADHEVAALSALEEK